MITIPPQLFQGEPNPDRALKGLAISAVIFLVNAGSAYLLWPFVEDKNLLNSILPYIFLLVVSIALMSLIPMAISIPLACLKLIPRRWWSSKSSKSE